MSDSVIVAVIAGAVAICVAYINSFLSESYKRFRDRSTLAASLAGELSAYENAWPIMNEALERIIRDAENGSPRLDFLRPIERPRDVIYERAVERLGILGVSTCESVVYVYGNINAFRVAMDVMSREHEKMTSEELVGRARLCQAALQRAATRGEVLLGSLHQMATSRFVPEWPWTPWIALLHW